MLQNIMFDKVSGVAKLANFGFYYLVVGGKAVEFFVGDMAFTAPEVSYVARQDLSYNTSFMHLSFGI